MTTFIFHWKNGEDSVSKGDDVSDAFSRLGYNQMSIGKLDSFEEISEFSDSEKTTYKMKIKRCNHVK